MTTLTYRAFHPLLLSKNPEERAKAKGVHLDMREESRVLGLSQELHDRLKRWMREASKDGRAAALITPAAMNLIPQAKAGFVPLDRLYIESEGAASVFASDPEAAGPLPQGVAFHASTDPGALAANFDLTPFLESYVRRLSGLMPQYVWQVGERYYHRTTGVALIEDPLRFEARRFPVPKQVVDAFGPLPPLPPAQCAVCGKADEKVVAQPQERTALAHGECVKAKL